MAGAEELHVEVVYAGPEHQRLVALSVPPGSSVREVIIASGLLASFPEIELESARTGIFSRHCLLTEIVREGDRVEIYRPLIADPKAARKARAAGLKPGA